MTAPMVARKRRVHALLVILILSTLLVVGSRGDCHGALGPANRTMTFQRGSFPPAAR
jgi:hypothetical protein